MVEGLSRLRVVTVFLIGLLVSCSAVDESRENAPWEAEIGSVWHLKVRTPLGTAMGTAFAVKRVAHAGKEYTLLMTASHVVRGGYGASLHNFDVEKRCFLVGIYSNGTDLAVLAVQSALPIVALGVPAAPGDKVYVVGNRHGLHEVLRGAVTHYADIRSNLGDANRSGNINAPVLKGFSGAPVFKGSRVVGLIWGASPRSSSFCVLSDIRAALSDAEATIRRIN